MTLDLDALEKHYDRAMNELVITMRLEAQSDLVAAFPALIARVRDLEELLQPRWVGNLEEGRLMECVSCRWQWEELSGGRPFKENHSVLCVINPPATTERGG